MLPTDFASTVAFETAAEAEAGAEVEADAEAEAEAEADAAVELDEATELDAPVVGDEPPLEHAASTVAAVRNVEKVRARNRMVQPPAKCWASGDHPIRHLTVRCRFHDAAARLLRMWGGDASGPPAGLLPVLLALRPSEGPLEAEILRSGAIWPIWLAD